jgi:hypothetical protein
LILRHPDKTKRSLEAADPLRQTSIDGGLIIKNFLSADRKLTMKEVLNVKIDETGEKANSEILEEFDFDDQTALLIVFAVIYNLASCVDPEERQEFLFCLREGIINEFNEGAIEESFRIK